MKNNLMNNDYWHPKAPKLPRYIYQGTTNAGKVISLPTEIETLKALSSAGGGKYENILHRYSFGVESGDYENE